MSGWIYCIRNAWLITTLVLFSTGHLIGGAVAAGITIWMLF
jgi:hypothetical protein